MCLIHRRKASLGQRCLKKIWKDKAYGKWKVSNKKRLSQEDGHVDAKEGELE